MNDDGDEHDGSDEPGDEHDGDADETARLKRILGDPRHPEWRKESEPLLAYAYPRLRSWIRSGRIRAMVARSGARGVSRVPEGLRVPRQDAHDLAVDTAVLAMRSFHNAVPRWDPALGRGLRSYFVGFCLMKFPDAYQSWRRRGEVAGDDTVPSGPGADRADPADPAPTPEEIATWRARFDHVARTPVERRVLHLAVEGSSRSEIIRQLRDDGVPMTRRKLASLFERFARRARDEESAE